MNEIRIPVPDGYEWTGEIRRVMPHEWYLVYPHGIVKQWGTGTSASYYPILRPAWQWPEWLLAPWIAMDRDGAWWGYMSEPVMSIADLEWKSSRGAGVCKIDMEFFAFTPPPCDDWTKSKRKNPRSGKDNNTEVNQ